jgi:hypothetical protein
MIGKQNQDHNYLRQAAGMVQKIQNQSQDLHHHQGNVVRSPIEIFGVDKTRIHDTRRIVLSQTEHPGTSEMLPLPESKMIMHESQIKFTVAGRTEPLKHFMLETLLSIQLKKISVRHSSITLAQQLLLRMLQSHA